ncbi:MAG: hypothetical protein M1820_001755 [Bogoriella megaspora]|nr:MAG: hypothetical protein M1820_001755 [Bogoriella megaspora]
MKVVLTGVTGFIGHEVLNQCLQNPSITSVVALSRRELDPPLTKNPKLKVVIVTDFLSYPPSVVEDLKGADACIWSLGKASIPDQEVARKVSIDYTMTAAKVFSEAHAELSNESRKFRFIYLSGIAAERDQTKKLWFMQEYRRIRVCPLQYYVSGLELYANPHEQGQVENELIAYAKEHSEAFESYIMRPGGVLSVGQSLRNAVFGMGPSVKVDVLAKAMIETAQNGSSQQITENSDIRLFEK